jgi:hypothetical protein
MINLQNRTFIGVVADNKDPKKLGRCRIRVINIFDNIPVEDIPWATPWKDLNGNSFILPEVGKLLTVIFDQGDIYKPEYIYAEHYNKNLENKLASLDMDDYTSMKALLFDHKTQIYVNESEGLKIEHKYNNINIGYSDISLNLKDTMSNLNLGDARADQQIILGNNFLDWFDEFVEILTTTPMVDLNENPICPHPLLIDHVKGNDPKRPSYEMLRDSKFLSWHIRACDNDDIHTVKNTVGQPETSDGNGNSFPVHRFNFGQAGDFLRTFDKLTNLAKRIKDCPRPWKKKKKKFDSRYNPPQQKRPLGSGSQNNNSDSSSSETSTSNYQSAKPTQNPYNPDNSKPADGIGNAFNSPATSQDYSKIDPQKEFEFYEEEDDMGKLVRYLESKSGSSPVSGKSEDYVIFEDPYVLNIIAFRNKKHEYGKITNRFDDQLWVAFKDEKNQWDTIRKYSVTTMPGHKIVDGKKVTPAILPDNVGFINYGQYINSYVMGYHNPDDYGKRHPALICDKVGIRLNKKKGKPSRDRYVNTVVNTQFGENIDGWVYGTGMNIHCVIPLDNSLYGDDNFPRASAIFEEVNNWSMGCIVFNNPTQYREFIGLCEEQKKKAKKSQYTLTVASLREFELFESELDFGDEIQGDFDEDITDRFQDSDPEDADDENIDY